MGTFRAGEPLVVDPPRVTAGTGPDAGTRVIVVGIRQGGESTRIRFRFTGVESGDPPLVMEAALAIALVPAMKLGCPLALGGPVDRRVLEGARRFQEIFTVWYPDFVRIPIDAEGVERPPPPRDDPRGAGLFFSGGLDSMYSLVKNREALTHAIFVHGCDVPLEDTAHRDRVSNRLRSAAAGFGVRLVEVETDLLAFSERHAHWGYHYHGSALAAIGLMLSGDLRRVLIASSYPYRTMVPWGSTFVTDPLWSATGLEIAIDGGEHNRLGKTRALAGDPRALRHLRVCFENPAGGYNCGGCEKCYRTMVGLRLCDALDRCPAFDTPLDLARMIEDDEVLKAAARYPAWGIFREEAARQGRDPELIDALDEVIRRSGYLQLVRQFAASKRDITNSPPWQEKLPKFRTRLWESLRENDPDWLAGKVLDWLPAIRESAFQRLWSHDRRWFRRRFRSARLARLAQRIRGGRA